MKILTLEQAVDYLELSKNIRSIDMDHAIINAGETIAGIPFVLVHDMHGQAVLTEGL